MALNPITLDHYNANKGIADSLLKLNTPFVYGTEVSLANYVTTVEDIKTHLEIRNALLEQFLKADELYFQSVEASDKMQTRLRNCIKGDKGVESDEFVMAGGTRQSEITSKAQATRNEKKKTTLMIDKKG